MIPPKILLLIPRLATPHDGELVATRDAITRLLLAVDLDWHALAAACGSKQLKGDVSPSFSAAFGDLARAARDLDRGQLTPRERSFIADMVRRGFSFRPSPRQQQWLVDIHDRLAARRAAA